MGDAKSRVCKVVVAGPLAPFVQDFTAALASSGYTPLTSVNELRLMAHLSRWLGEYGLGAADLTAERIELFLDAQRAGGYGARCTRRGLGPLMETLTRLGVVPVEVARPAEPGSAGEALLASFRTYLLDERGLAPGTAAAYAKLARRFLDGCPASEEIASLTAGEVTRAVVRESQSVSAKSTKYFTVAVRCLLRFCFLQGWLASDLSAAVLSATGPRRSFVPLGIAKADADALLRSCDRRRSVGRRDYAILHVLLRLGLRAGEVAALTLEDIDWRAGEIVVQGKGRRQERLPLPVDVGEALTGYLKRGRPVTIRRELFLRAIAPIGPLGRGGISLTVRRACRRAGIAEIGAHRLRHTMACEMVNAGVGLTQIGQVLRHRSQLSTAIYARVDMAALREIAQPWPGAQR
jgi:site-specific recombinase XerD